MAKSDRNAVLAAAGFLAIPAALAWTLYPEQPKLTGNIAYKEQQLSYSAGGPDCLPFEIDSLRGRERTRRTITCQEAEEQHRQTANDLIRQRRSADAADATAVLRYQQTRIASWGLFLGFVTMAAAIAAAWFARRAAVATEDTVQLARDSSHGATEALSIAARNADAASEQVAVARETARHQLRAYVGIKRIDLVDRHGFDPRFRVWIQNYGSTPAQSVVVHASAGVLPVEFKYPEGYAVHHELGTIEPSRDQALFVGMPFQSLNEQAVELTTGSVTAQMKCLVTYIDIYN